MTPDWHRVHNAHTTELEQMVEYGEDEPEGSAAGR